MKLIYSHPNPFLVYNAKNILEAHFLKVELKNEFSAGAVGELPPTDNWLELWLYQDSHFDLAEKLLAEVNAQFSGSDWHCVLCGETNGKNFEFCWSCSALPIIDET